MELVALLALILACGEEEIVADAPPAEPAPEVEPAPVEEAPAPDPEAERLAPRVGIRIHVAEGGALNEATGEGPLDVAHKLEVRAEAGAEARFAMFPAPDASNFQIWDMAPEEAGVEAPRLDSRLALGTVGGSADRAVDLSLSALPRGTDWCATPSGPGLFSLNDAPLDPAACTPLFVKPEGGGE